MHSPRFVAPYSVGLVGWMSLLLVGCVSSANTLAARHLALLQAGETDVAQQQYCIPQDELRLYDISSYEVLSLTHKNRDSLRYMEVVVSLESSQTRLVSTDTRSVPMPVDYAVLEIWESDDFFDLAVLSAAPDSKLARAADVSSTQVLSEHMIRTRADINTANQCIFVPPGQFNEP
ncbi:hypothetical protein [Vacuolonema iberomarrocanum]|uniref:hypothetical protein n=1 Tax=Vacuolonema iberomarrocanum TaxID=3454632 RepID=UPI0019DA9836|nr:hypothetical protein [filamentous cyanobacterium LEGE 07170]